MTVPCLSISEQLELILAMRHGDEESVQVWDIILNALVIIEDNHKQLWLMVNTEREIAAKTHYARGYGVPPPFRRPME